ncbi:MAG: hypothetical protein K0M45_05285 [Candidatus Paracaedibacteraceae bacterium]|nr:hypothetical protein [Candidatus Paracaedibacteraceae bacterium]
MKQILVPLTIRAMFCASASLSAENNYMDLTLPEFEGSYLFSPLGINETLKITQLIIPSSEKDRQKFLKLFLKNRKELSSAVDFTSYVILDDSISMKERMLEQLTNVGNIVLKTNFSNPLETVSLINQRVEDKTQGLISKIIEVPEVPTNRGMVLLNTVVIRSAWKYPLKEKADALLFRFSEEAVSNVRANCGPVSCQLYESEQSYFVGLETTELDLSMIFKLNKNGYTSSPLTRSELLAYHHKKIPQQIMLTLPSGYIASTHDLLRSLSADPSILKFKTASLTIDTIKQVVILEWDNLGLTGGASTASENEVMLMDIHPLKEITIDRPFSFACIQETFTNPEIILIGSIQDMDGLIAHYTSKRSYGLKRNFVSSGEEKH